MANLSALPPELLMSIQEDLDEDDLLALRMISQEFNLKFKDHHLRKLYSHRSVFFTPVSLENLVKISRHSSGVNRLINQLTFQLNNPSVLDLTREEFQELVKVDGESVDNTLSVWEKMHEDMKMHRSEYTKTSRAYEHEAIALLTIVFTNLLNIRSLIFDLGPFQITQLSRSNLNLHFPSAGMIPGTRTPKSLHAFCQPDKDSDSNDLYRIWSAAVTRSAFDGPNKIQEISMKSWSDVRGVGLPIAWFSMGTRKRRRFQSAFSSLRVLNIVIERQEYRSFEFDDLIDNRAFYQWISIAAISIENLTIRGQCLASEQCYKSRECRIVCGIHKELRLPKLRKLALGNLCLTPEPLLEFLASCSELLVSVSFENCTLPNSKDDWFQVLKLLRPAHLEYFALITVQARGQEYYLNDIIYDDLWDSVTPALPAKGCIAQNNSLGKELDAHGDADSFWNCLSDGHWMDLGIYEMISWDSDD